jgi:hypothetical protein
MVWSHHPSTRWHTWFAAGTRCTAGRRDERDRQTYFSRSVRVRHTYFRRTTLAPAPARPRSTSESIDGVVPSSLDTMAYLVRGWDSVYGRATRRAGPTDVFFTVGAGVSQFQKAFSRFRDEVDERFRLGRHGRGRGKTDLVFGEVCVVVRELWQRKTRVWGKVRICSDNTQLRLSGYWLSSANGCQ